MTDDELLKQNAHIPDSEIEKDITDTKREISDLKFKVKGYDELSNVSSIHESKMSAFRRDAALTGIRERQIFVEKLQRLLNARKTKTETKERH